MITMTTGRNPDIFFLKLILKKLPNKLIASNIGMVPSPKNNINMMEELIFPVPVEMINAAYSAPQGKKPSEPSVADFDDDDLPF